MREKLYTYFRNKGIYARVYRTYLAVAIFTLLILAIVLSVTYSVNTIRNFRMREADSLNYYSDNIANELYRFDNSSSLFRRIHIRRISCKIIFP